jgi:hypothetical protein
MSAALLLLVALFATLATVGFGPAALSAARRLRGARKSAPRRSAAYDPGRERRAERKARELLRAAVGPDDYEMYEGLGFLRVVGRRGDREAGYAYLIYPHRPIVAYDTATGELLSEYCVGFPDREETGHGTRLPDADDALAKWMSLHGDERGLISGANMHLPGRQVDPDQVRRDLRRLAEWDARRERAVAA